MLQFPILYLENIYFIEYKDTNHIYPRGWPWIQEGLSSLGILLIYPGLNVKKMDTASKYM